ncbi:MAG: M24 family metallopeptidase [Pseudomonadota bacterium]
MDPSRFVHHRLPPRFFNEERLRHQMNAQGLDGLVVSTSNNVFYLTGFNALAQKSDEPRPFALVISRHEPEHPVLVLPDYYVGAFATHPTWIEDFRPYRGVMLPFDIDVPQSALLRFAPSATHDEPWMRSALSHYAPDMTKALEKALSDLGLDRGRVGFDDLRLGQKFMSRDRVIDDAYAILMSTRSVKTQGEIAALERATSVNRYAIETAIGAWQPGMSYNNLNEVYEHAVVERGGHVHDPGAMVFFNGGGVDPYISISAGSEDFDLRPGMHVMFDCHGTLGLYCWDGGKTWVVDRQLDARSQRVAQATADAMVEIEAAMRPGVRVSELQAIGRNVYRRSNVGGADDVIIFFHGLGLSHLDQAMGETAEGSATGDWMMEQDMVVATHLLYPGSDTSRIWLEDIGHIQNDGARSIFGWDFLPHQSG